MSATHFPIAVLFSLVLLTMPCTADIYKWVDAEGRTHYSDEKPEQPGASEPVELQLPKIHSLDKPDRRLTQVQRQAQREAEKRHRVRLSQPRPKSNSHNCKSLQSQLERVQAQLRRGYTEPRGNALRERRRSLRDTYNTHCR